jgi:hypothetical protein
MCMIDGGGTIASYRLARAIAQIWCLDCRNGYSIASQARRVSAPDMRCRIVELDSPMTMSGVEASFKLLAPDSRKWSAAADNVLVDPKPLDSFALRGHTNCLAGLQLLKILNVTRQPGTTSIGEPQARRREAYPDDALKLQLRRLESASSSDGSYESLKETTASDGRRSFYPTMQVELVGACPTLAIQYCGTLGRVPSTSLTIALPEATDITH